MGKEILLSSAKWLSVVFIIENIAQFAVNVVLTRLLTPIDYGVYSLLFMVISVAQVIVEGGLNSSLLRKETIVESEYSTVFNYQLFLSIIAIIIIIAIHTLLVQLLNINGNEKPLVVIAFYILFFNLGNSYRSYAQKKYEFKILARISIIALIFSSILSLFLAIKGFGIYALIFKLLAYYIVEFILLTRMIKLDISMRFDIKELKPLLNFGYKLTISNLLYNFYSNYYYLFIGKYFSVTDLGFYYKAEQLQKVPTNAIINIISKLFLPYLAKHQSNVHVLRLETSKILGAIFFWGATFSVYMFLFSNNIVLILFGEKWIGSVLYFKIFSILTLTYLLNSFLLIVMMVIGNSGKILIADIIKFTVALPLFLILIKLPAHYCIYSLFIQNVIYFIILVKYISTYLKLDYAYLLKVLEAFLIVVIPISVLLYYLQSLENINIYSEMAIFSLFFTVIILLFIKIFKYQNVTFLNKVIKWI